MTLNFFGREIVIGKEAGAVIAISMLIAAGGLGAAISSGSNQVVIAKKNTQASDYRASENRQASTLKQVKDEKPQEVEMPEIKVYVIGCVKNRGIVTLKKGQLIDDAIKAAGGATEDADLDNINLVYRLRDNVTIRIKPQQKPMNAPLEVQSPAAPPKAGTGVEITTGSGGVVLNDEADDEDNKKININTASENELDALPGVGKETAKSIVAYRKKNGPFSNIQELMKLPGLKGSRFEKIKDMIETD